MNIFTERDFINNFEKIYKIKGRKLNEFYCKDCGKFLIEDSNILNDLIKNNKNVNKDGLVVYPKKIFGKEYFRVKCFNCFEKRFERKAKKLNIVNYDLCHLLDIPEEIIKEYISKRISSLENFITKYGEVEGTKKWNKLKERQSFNNSIEGYIERYGETGTKKWEEYRQKISFGNSIEYYIKKYGKEKGIKKYEEKNLKIAESNHIGGFIKQYGEAEGKIKWEELNKRKAQTQENYIKKLGEIEGTKKWEEYRQKLSDNSSCKLEYYLNKGLTEEEAEKALKKRQTTFSLEIYISSLGEVEGTKKWNSFLQKQSFNNSIEGYIERYGETGTKKWEEFLNKRYKNFKSPFSEISQELFKSIHNNLEIVNNIYYATLNKEYFLKDGIEKIYFFDFVDLTNKKIIEFNGDFWHANPIKYKKNESIKYPGSNNTKSVKDIWQQDKQKLELAKSKGFDVLVIWESEYKANKEKVVDKCIKFLYNTNKGVLC